MVAFSFYGSFNPTESGFYLSVLGGVIWTLITGYLLGRFQANDKERM